MVAVTKLFGIVNLCSESFTFSSEPVMSQVMRMINQGVDIIDVGAIPTNPKVSRLVTQQEEWVMLRNVLPGIINLAHEHGIWVSLDSFYFGTIRQGVEMGIDIINDQSGLDDPRILELLEYPSVKKAVFMHQCSLPTFSDKLVSGDIIVYLQEYISKKISFFNKHKVDISKLIFDPGLGFGKSIDQCYEVINHISEMRRFPVLIGHSRKRMVASLSPLENPSIEDLDMITFGLSGYMIAKQVDYLRVHNLKFYRKMLDMLK
ncbi:MAG: pterin binding enzyme family protein [Candidatus Xenolissoclinum pacificiensis L6]|uniref:Pterin binding enzyme family protein n=1 Tax=Candidatus Xenolissoclinum pacificiensis L6 TaxID=1401685 RepID=W2UZM1_9RICK|nr:MAG: pterin binding enzyme family protein [Candidatus Xenolissoclinum pacificiensis L6]